VFARRCQSLGRWVALACLIGLAGVGRFAGAAPPKTGTKPKETAASKSLPVYEFLVKSGLSKRASPEAAVLRAVVTINRGGRRLATSTVKVIARKHQPETLNAIQAAIVNATLVEACETQKVGSLEIAYSDATVLTVIINKHYYEITTSAGTIRFTSQPLTTILHDLLE